MFYQPNIKYENLSDVITSVWQKYGKNKLVIGTALEKESTLYERNKKIRKENQYSKKKIKTKRLIRQQIKNTN